MQAQKTTAGYDVGQEIGVLICSLAREGERSAVVVGAARLDVALERFLKRVMHHHPGGSDNLFDPDRPLGTFSAKIALAYRLGLLDRDLEHAIQLVRKIRNEFAHSVTSASLSESSHSSRVRELRNYAKGATDLYERMRSTLEPVVRNEPLLSFCVSLSVFITCVEAASLQSKPLFGGHPATLTPPQGAEHS